LFGWRTRYWSFLLKLSKRLPSWTITAQPGSAIGPFHWENRRLSVEEMMCLQTFPKNYSIIGGWTAGVRQLGNAVPSALAEVLARAISSQILGGGPYDGLPTLIPEPREDRPPPEAVAPVPDEYMDLVGAHADHPGTGKGPGAVQRS
jgi:DNA (cytosine-5)-methyltransferase 1